MWPLYWTLPETFASITSPIAAWSGNWSVEDERYQETAGNGFPGLRGMVGTRSADVATGAGESALVKLMLDSALKDLQ